MNHLAVLTLVLSAGLAGNCALAQTSPKAKAKAKPAVAADNAKVAAAVMTVPPQALSKSNVGVQADASTQFLNAYSKAQSLEVTNLRLALGAYKEAAQLGHGPSQKRLWELLKDTPGSESVASVYQIAAWNQKVPGVPEPKAPIRLN